MHHQRLILVASLERDNISSAQAINQCIEPTQFYLEALLKPLF